MTIDPTTDYFFIDAQIFLIANVGDWKLSIAKLGNWKSLVIDCGDQKLVTKFFK
jgi:hypothetical protein